MEGRPASSPRVRLRFVTAERWLLGHVDVGRHRLLDLLNAEPGEGIVVEQALLQSDLYPYREGEGPGFAVLNPAHVILIVPAEEAAVGALRAPQAACLHGRAELTRVGLGAYEVVGNLHLPTDVSLREGALAAGARFLTVTDAAIRRIGGVGYLEQQEIVLVNRERIEFLMPGTAAPLFGVDEGQALLD